jgi:hypothetical protein
MPVSDGVPSPDDGWSRGQIAFVGALLVTLTLAAHLIFSFISSLCGVADNPFNSTWCTRPEGVQVALLVGPVVTAVGTYVWSVRSRAILLLIAVPVTVAAWDGLLTLAFHR